MSSPIVHNKSETGPRVNLLRPIIEIQQPNHPVRLQAPAPVSQKGPMTRRRCRDRNVRHFVESVTAIDHVQATNRNEATTRTGHGTTPKGQVAPRRPVRKRQGSLGAPARTQPKRGARKKSTQEQIPPIRSAFILGLIRSSQEVHLTQTYLNSSGPISDTARCYHCRYRVSSAQGPTPGGNGDRHSHGRFIIKQ